MRNRHQWEFSQRCLDGSECLLAFLWWIWSLWSKWSVTAPNISGIWFQGQRWVFCKANETIALGPSFTHLSSKILYLVLYSFIQKRPLRTVYASGSIKPRSYSSTPCPLLGMKLAHQLSGGAALDDFWVKCPNRQGKCFTLIELLAYFRPQTT